MTAPCDNLVRAITGPDTATVGDGRTLFGHFAVFNTWTRINSKWEGLFLERVARGALDRTMKERRGQIKVLYDHGKDPQLGNKPLGTLNELREDATGGYYEVSLIDTPYNNDFIIPASRAGLLGTSFRMSIPEGGDTWMEPTQATDHNPDMLPERTITNLDLFEFGPVTFPAYPTADTNLRSATDDFLEHFLNDPVFVARFKERVGPAVVDQIRAGLPTGDDTAGEAPTELTDDTRESADGGERDTTQERRAAYFERTTAGFVAHLSRLKEAPQ